MTGNTGVPNINYRVADPPTGYRNLRCTIPTVSGVCNGEVALEISECLDAFGSEWTPRVKAWAITCSNGHTLCESADVEDDDNRALPMVAWVIDRVPTVREVTPASEALAAAIHDIDNLADADD